MAILCICLIVAPPCDLFLRAPPCDLFLRAPPCDLFLRLPMLRNALLVVHIQACFTVGGCEVQSSLDTEPNDERSGDVLDVGALSHAHEIIRESTRHTLQSVSSGTTSSSAEASLLSHHLLEPVASSSMPIHSTHVSKDVHLMRRLQSVTYPVSAPQLLSGPGGVPLIVLQILLSMPCGSHCQ